MQPSSPPSPTPRLHSSWIDREARDVVSRLQDHGFITYLVGGCVRDLLVGILPKDFDIATTARPQQIKKKIRGAYIIGRRFRLVLVKRGDKQFEVATFRRECTEEDLPPELLPLPPSSSAPEDPSRSFPSHPSQASSPSELDSIEPLPPDPILLDPPLSTFSENLFGTPEQDALRRDFTINGLFYDPIQGELIDYVGGLKDIHRGSLRMIGPPEVRIREDSIRSLRALRLSHRIGFSIDPELRAAIQRLAPLLVQSVLPRRRLEYLKILQLPQPDVAFLELRDLGLMEHLFPHLSLVFKDPGRWEVFLHGLGRTSELYPDFSQPMETFFPIVLATHLSLDGLPLEERREKLMEFMRLDLGTHRIEQMELLHILELSQKFSEVESFCKRGQRRRRSFLAQRGFGLALQTSLWDYMYPPEVLHFWHKQYESHQNQPEDPSQNQNQDQDQGRNPDSDPNQDPTQTHNHDQDEV